MLHNPGTYRNKENVYICRSGEFCGISCMRMLHWFFVICHHQHKDHHCPRFWQNNNAKNVNSLLLLSILVLPKLYSENTRMANKAMLHVYSSHPSIIIWTQKLKGNITGGDETLSQYISWFRVKRLCFVQRLRAVFTQLHACDEKLDFQMFHDVIYHRKYTRLSTIYTFNTTLIDLQK